tara:strand:+ start:1004 stop:1633 length:630 start_codon:yes stop_codon:yes gene_type:complete
MSYLEPLNPNPYIFKDSYDFKFDDIKERVDEYCEMAHDMTVTKKFDTLEMDGGITTVVCSNIHPPHDWEHFHDFRDNFLYPRVNEIWERWRLMPLGKHISQGWINRHPRGGWTKEHHHQNVQVAVSCYLKVPENSGRFMVKNPLEVHKMGEPLNYYYYDQQMDYTPIDVKTNDVLFFPGWLKHKTEKSNADENRYIMSLNIMGRMEFNP